MLEPVLVLVLAAHLLAMNVGIAAPLLCIWLHIRANRKSDRVAGHVGQRTAWASVLMLVGGFVLGLMQLGLLWLAGDEAYFETLSHFDTARYAMILGEFAFSVALLALYAALWKKLGKWTYLHGLIAFVAVTNLFYHFPPLMTALRTVDEAAPKAYLDTPLVRHLEVLVTSLHVWLASIAVAGVYVMGVAMRQLPDDATREAASRIVRTGAWVAFLPTVAQLGVGIWLVIAIDETAVKMIMGQNAVATGLFVLAFLASLALMHMLASVAFGKIARSSIIRAMATLTIVVVLMTALLRQIQ